MNLLFVFDLHSQHGTKNVKSRIQNFSMIYILSNIARFPKTSPLLKTPKWSNSIDWFAKRQESMGYDHGEHLSEI